MTRYVILRPVEPPRICFLWEVILWRAFGAYPTGYWDDKGKDIREFPEDYELFDPPLPDDTGELTYLAESQTELAGLPPDPSLVSVMEDRESFELDHYDKLIAMLQNSENDMAAEINELRTKRAEAETFWRDYTAWRKQHDAYVDQFQAELLLALRRGDIIAQGRRLPRRDRERTERLFERLGSYTGDIIPEAIPKDLWVSTRVDWRECSLTSPDVAYVWISVLVEDMLRLFPPSELIPPDKVAQIGECYAITERAFAHAPKTGATSRGRPSLPWEDFYVEVARLFRDGEMPAKKEAAIALFQAWFEKELGLTASRSAIGQKLKPFFDHLK